MSAQALSARADDDLRPARRSGRRSGAAASGPKYSGEGDQPFRLIVISEYAYPGDQHAPVIARPIPQPPSTPLALVGARRLCHFRFEHLLERSPEPQIRRNASSPAQGLSRRSLQT
jgi:hypothetical protein